MSSIKLQSIITPAILNSLRTQPHLARHWYYVAGVTLSALNRPDEVPNLLISALKDSASPTIADGGLGLSLEEQLYIIRRLREGLIKSAAVVGVPKVINALLALKSATPENLLDESPDSSPTGRRAEVYCQSFSSVWKRGQLFFEKVYGKISKRVMGQMDRSGTEDLGLAARLMYGYILSNEKVLDAKETSFVCIAGLIPQDVNPQLKGHLRGALNNGATVEEVRAVRDAVIQICQAAGMAMLAEDAAGGWGWREEIANVKA
ncbi:AhpD-like protein [Phyllosticta citribraziliensis]|uniref:AhpD-like protein n=1 Tax=Phyllosticta citribraziliensis TaxID=989973 RepID=A0ABR1LXB6_9PEZI